MRPHTSFQRPSIWVLLWNSSLHITYKYRSLSDPTKQWRMLAKWLISQPMCFVMENYGLFTHTAYVMWVMWTIWHLVPWEQPCRLMVTQICIQPIIFFIWNMMRKSLVKICFRFTQFCSEPYYVCVKNKGGWNSSVISVAHLSVSVWSRTNLV